MYLITFFSTIFGIVMTILLVAGMVIFIAMMNPLVAIFFFIALVAFSSTFWRKKKK